MLTRDEQRALHAKGGFLDQLIGYEHPCGGGSCTALGIDGWLEYFGGKWITFTERPAGGGGLILRIRWGDVEAYGQALPADLRARLIAHQEADRVHAASFRSYPNRQKDPDGWAEADRYYHDVHFPAWQKLSAERKRLLDECYPLAVDDEPADLLELLEAMA